jgi:hypothetical protein
MNYPALRKKRATADSLGDSIGGKDWDQPAHGHSMDMEQELKELDRLKPHVRGRRFESFIAAMLEEEGFEVTCNPKAATPRQTDLCAKLDQWFFIVEAKWHKRPLDVGHISDVRDRLQRTTTDVFACVFSMSGFTNTAVEDLRDHRASEMLLYTEHEIRGIATRELSFADSLKRKREEIRKNGAVWFADLPTGSKWHRPSVGPEKYVFNNRAEKWFFAKTQGDDVIFARDLLDLGSYSESAVSLRMGIDAYDTDALSRVLRLMKRQLGLSGADSFSIHQRYGGWYGTGIDNFLAAIRNWKQRYEEVGAVTYHHSESLAYFDRIDGGGFVGLTLLQEVGKRDYLHSCYIEILMSGIPVDTSGIRRLCEKFGNEEARFEVLKKKPIYSNRFHPAIEIEPVGTILDPVERGWITGLVARNPFYKPDSSSSLHLPSLESDSAIGHLTNTEFVICRLGSWHPASKTMDRYDLLRVEGCWIENLPVLYLKCDWR